MTMSTRIIIAAIGAAVLASPVMAQPTHRQGAGVVREYRTVTRIPAPQVDAGQVDVHDCSIKSVFTQCGFAH
jgi:hypothetical protein